MSWIGFKLVITLHLWTLFSSNFKLSSLIRTSLTLSWWSSYHIQTNSLICSANQLTGFYNIGTAVELSTLANICKIDSHNIYYTRKEATSGKSSTNIFFFILARNWDLLITNFSLFPFLHWLQLSFQLRGRSFQIRKNLEIFFNSC